MPTFANEYAPATNETQVWQECSAEDYTFGLECLWPAYWEGSKFLVGEPCSHTDEGVPTFRPFFQLGDKYYRGQQPMTRTEFRKTDIRAALVKP